MEINLEEINSNIKDEILIEKTIDFDNGLVEKASIKKLENVTFSGRIFKDLDETFILKGILKGNMILEDSISLDDVVYPFSIELEENIEENLQNSKNSIDIIPILWQNIVLEVPLRFTKVDDYSSYCGDGWRLVGEERNISNNPFVELSKNFKEE